MDNTPKDPKTFVDYIKTRREKGMTEAEIARVLGLKTSEYRKILSESRDALGNKKG